MIGSERLTDAIQESNNPAEVLNLLNIGVKKSLHQTDKEDSTRDGLDIALCSVDTKNKIINYSGANRPLWILRKGATEIEEIKATKNAIGGLTKDEQQFQLHQIQLNEGDSIYLSTDGYGDLFSEDGKKLKTKKLKEILVENQDKSMTEQGAYLDDFAEIWKNGSEQIDDILIIGIRF
jgi:serine phosphatase RsbU (regulator of sigma subunit)